MVDFLIVIGVLSFGILGGIGLLIWYFKPIRDFVIRIARCGRKEKVVIPTFKICLCLSAEERRR